MGISGLNSDITDILIIDFEQVPHGDIYHIGAVFKDKIFQKKDIKDVKAALNKLSEFSKGARYVLGHNIINHDLPMVKKYLPEAYFLNLPVIDTLFLSPLAFPENPYHKLIKGYKIVKTSKNDPVADAKLAKKIFDDQKSAFSILNKTDPDLILFFTFALELTNSGNFDLFYSISKKHIDKNRAKKIFKNLCAGKVCSTGLDKVWAKYCDDKSKRSVLAYVLSWIRVSGGNSIIPPWVKHEFPDILDIIRQLRYSCNDELCEYCKKHNNSEILLKKYFGFDSYRTLVDGRPLQKEIIDSSLKGDALLGILPTGGGKSICYQIPGLHRYNRLGQLTVVISPLKALMKDQVDNLNRATGTESAAAINGSLTLPERGAVMERVRLGDIGILYISPEQLRNYSIAQLIKTRDVGLWVFDEAHCLSKWGHDFRPDYLHVSEFIKEYSSDMKTFPLVGAFTATAKKDVIEEIRSHFSEQLGFDLACFIGGIQRDNLNFQVWPVTKNEKFDVIVNCLKETLLDSDTGGGAIVYCSSRRTTEEISEFLNEKGILSEPFHAGRSEPDKRNIQDDFVSGKIPVICATNAFGMGIDKKDIRLVIHADIPGSLENYLQEAGRAGRDMEESDCILLYEKQDIENQFSLNSYSRISFKDIKKILKILKKRGAKIPEIVITPGEIMRLIGHQDFTDNDTKARIGISWLERKGFVKRSFNQTFFFNGTPIVKNMEQVEKKINLLNLSMTIKAVYKTIMGTLFNADKNSILSADTICAELGSIENLPERYMDSRYIINVLGDMAKTGLIKEGIVMTAFVQPRGKGNSLKQFGFLSGAEKKMLGIMAEMAPESWTSPDTPDVFNLRLMSQRLKDMGFENINSEIVERMLRSLAADKGQSQGKSLKIRGKRGIDQQQVYVKFSWQEIQKRMELRHDAAKAILDAIIMALPLKLRTGQAPVLSEFFIADIEKSMKSEVSLACLTCDLRPLIEQSLLYLHDMKIITLQNGLGVFRQAMTLEILPGAKKRRYTKGDYEPLSHHYDQKNVQVHVMEKYASLGLEKLKAALNFVSDYFSSSHKGFIKQYFPNQKDIINTAMTQDAYKKIIQSLENNIQESIVAAPLKKNILVLAGPGSGKTKIIVHRCAWLIKAKSIKPESILVLCFNHQSMLELGKRIKALTGKQAKYLTIMTYHGFAMRLTGRSFQETQFNEKIKNKTFNFNDVIKEAVNILNGTMEISGIESDGARQYLLARYRYILVDEYQDIDDVQYQFISALTGRLEQDKDAQISIMAVGDDDQSIYGFRNANVKFIKKFKEDYQAKTFYLIENYRSTYPIIMASSSFIALNQNRMKTDYPCQINSKRKLDNINPWDFDKEDLVKIVNVPNLSSQAVFVAEEIKTIMHGNPKIKPDDFAIISRQGIFFSFLVAARMALAAEHIDFCYSIKSSFGFPMFKIREIQIFIQYLETNRKKSISPLDLKQDVMDLFKEKNMWTNQIEIILQLWCEINSDIKISLLKAKNFVLETFFEEKREQKTGNGVFLGTVHSVKGMEFPFVFILDGAWEYNQNEIEEERRLFYVGMTRAEQKLYLCSLENSPNPHVSALKNNDFIDETNSKNFKLKGFDNNLSISIIGMEDLFISFPGLFPKNHSIHQCLLNLKTGDKVNMIENQGKIHVVNANNDIIACLSKKGLAQWQHKTHHIVNARVLGIIQRQQQDSEEDYQNLKVESWEIPIIEVLYSL